MKIMNIYKKVMFLALGVATLSLQSCKDDDQPGGGMPMVNYIRCLSSEIKADNDPADMHYTNGELVEKASPASVLALVGENLTSVKEIWFNDKKATLNTSYITDKSLIVTIPREVPQEVTNKIYLINGAEDTVKVDFLVDVPAPEITTMSCEYAQPGEEVTLYGSYMVSYSDVPFQVFFKDATGAPIEAYVKSIAENNMSAVVIVPEGAEEGSVTASTRYGTASSGFHYKDSRGLITNFDNPDGFGDNSGRKGIVPQGWNLAMTYGTEGGIDGYYAQVGNGSVTMPEDGGWTEDFKISWWCGNWGGDPMSIKEGPGTPLRNIFPAGYFDKPEKLAFKFEICVPASNPWKAGSLQVLFVNNQQCANDTWQNNTYIHTIANGGLSLCRGLYTPWLATGSFDTGGKWITVTMPISDFTYNMDGTKGEVAISPESFDSFTMWPVSGGMKGTECQPIIRYDNIRIVPIK